MSSPSPAVEPGDPLFAPLHLPMSRRLETLAVVLWSLLLPFCLVLTVVLFSVSVLFLPMCVYTLYCLVDGAQNTGGRPQAWLKGLGFWKVFRDFFPVTLHKEVDLDPSKNYVFGYHPHGIISIGAFLNFATESTGFSEKFPGIKLRLLTLASNFRIPFFRDYLLGLGICSAAAESCNYILNSGPGNSLMLVIGGAAEALDARPGFFDLVLAGRKGFIKVALRNGSSLVPCLCFGENDLFDQVENPKGSKLRNFQVWLQKIMGFSMPLFFGRGVFNYHFGLLPQRRHLRTVVGVPIDCPKIEPTDDQVDEYHQKYIAGLRSIWDKYKNEYAPTRRRSLQFSDVDNKKSKKEN